MSLDDLLRNGRIEEIEKDAARAISKLEEASRHLNSADVIASTDPEGAYVLVYDAARKAIDAHMAASGYRASKSRPGAHHAIAVYATIAIGGEYAANAAALDGMRKQRNKTEYGHWYISASRLASDRVHAERLVDAVRDVLGV